MTPDLPDPATLPQLPVHIQLGPSLAARLDLPAWAEAVTGRLAEALADYGLAATPVVEIAPNAAIEGLALTIAGSPCFYPATAPAEALALAVGWPLANWKTPNWETFPSDIVATALLWLCEAAVRCQPDRLFTPAVAEAWLARASTAPADPPAYPPDILARLTLAWQGRLPPQETPRVSETLGVLPAATPEGESPTLSPWAMVESWLDQTPAAPLVIEIHPAYLETLTIHASPEEREQFKLWREEIFYELGLHLPPIHWQPDPALPPATFRLRYRAWRSLPQVGLAPDEVLVNAGMGQPGWLASVAWPAVHPATLARASRIEVTYAALLEEMGYTTWGPLGYILLCLTRHVRQQAGVLLQLAQVADACEQLRQTHPALVEAALRQAPLPLLAQVLRCLVAEGISLRHLRACLQATATFATLSAPPADAILFDDRLALPYAAASDMPPNPAWLSSHIRAALRAYISYKVGEGQLSLTVYVLDAELEKHLTNILHQYEGGLMGLPLLATIPTALQWAVVEAVREAVAQVAPPYTGRALLTSTDLRPVVQALVGRIWPGLAVVSYGDLTPQMQLRPVRIPQARQGTAHT